MNMNMLKLFLSVVFFSIPFLSPKSANANLGDLNSFGAKIAALGGAGAAEGLHPFSAYYNPGALGANSSKRLHLSWGLVWLKPSFLPIEDVVIQNDFNSDRASASPTYGDVDNNYRSTLGQQIGIAYRVWDEGLRPTLGISMFLPIDQIGFMDSGESFVPEYALYRARTQRPQIDVAGGVHLGGGLSLGAGLHFGFSLASSGSIFINTKTNTSSSMRFISSMKAKASPYFGLQFESPSKPGVPALFSAGAVMRFPVTSDNTMTLNNAARTFGDVAALDFNFNAVSALFYDPASLELGMTFQEVPWAKLFIQLDYQMWSRYRSPALQINQPQTTLYVEAGGSGTLRINPSFLPTYQFVNIWIPRIGQEINLTETDTVRFGYSFRPSILASLSNDAGNLLDPSKHMLSLGWGGIYQHFLGFEVETEVDVNLTYQILAKQRIAKSPGNEFPGSTTGYKIGYPEYYSGGHVFGMGLSLGFKF